MMPSMTRLMLQRGELVIVALLGLATSIPATGQLADARRSSRSAATLPIGLWTLWHDKEITVSPTHAERTMLRSCETCAAAPLTHKTQINAIGDRLTIGDSHQTAAIFLSGPILLSAHGETLSLNNPIHITSRNGALVLAVTLPIESYVERVVASESGSADSPESQKALAIVVRSFALHQAHGHPDYDLCDSTHCQLLHWGGNPERRVAAHAATLATGGETLWFHGTRVEAWFHQNCGGRTASPSEVWPGRKRMPWLDSRPDTYCSANGAREWSANLSLSDLTAALANDGLVRPGWKTLAVFRRGESGRAATLRVDSTEISAEAFRLAVGRAMGWNRILSNWFEATQQGDRFIFHGRGSGHGVGLCQTGSAAMAAAGRDSNQILAQYFPGAAVADEASGLAWQSLRGPGFTLETLDPADSAYLPELNRALAEAVGRSGLKATRQFTVRSFASTSAFRNATLAPGWVAAFTEGDWIAAQPLRTLAGRKLLVPVLRHEFLHGLIESQAEAKGPLWLREGLVEAWSGEAPSAEPPPALIPGEVDRALAHSTSEAQSATAHRAAAWYATRLLSRYGKDQVFEWLRSGVPSSAISALR